MLFNQVSLMLTLHIYSPAYIVLKFFLLVSRRLQQDIDRFRIRDPFKIVVQHKFQLFY
jgi:hypothetical protein